jgi:DNA-binding transcriptional ArsR family regulator
MMVKKTSSPFGGQTRTRVLLALRLMGESYPRELARLLDAPLSGVQKALAALERDGLVAGRTMGRTRLVQLNPRYFAREALGAFLLRLTEPEVELRERVSAVRRRPRRAGKPL